MDEEQLLRQVELTSEDRVWAGPFASHEAIVAALDEAIFETGLERDDDTGELLTLVVVLVGDGWWVHVPAPLARGVHTFFVELAFDPENEWGSPIGYDVFALSRRDGAVFRGEMIRAVREETSPDCGEVDGGIAEASRLTGASFVAEDRIEMGVVGWVGW